MRKGSERLKRRVRELGRFSFALTGLILEAMEPPQEGFMAIIYGPLGIGKTTYQVKVAVDLLMRLEGFEEAEAWERVKEVFIFTPREFFDKLLEAGEGGEIPIPILLWDDAGVWLYALDWHEPFHRAFTKWLSLARTDVSALLFSTPSPQMVLAKLRGFPQLLTVRIVKTGERPAQWSDWKRVAKIYRWWRSPDGKKSGVRRIAEDHFYCRMPDDFYAWYRPRREHYGSIARRLMEEKWRKLMERGLLDEEGLRNRLRELGHPEFDDLEDWR